MQSFCNSSKLNTVKLTTSKQDPNLFATSPCSLYSYWWYNRGWTLRHRDRERYQAHWYFSGIEINIARLNLPHPSETRVARLLSRIGLILTTQRFGNPLECVPKRQRRGRLLQRIPLRALPGLRTRIVDLVLLVGYSFNWLHNSPPPACHCKILSILKYRIGHSDNTYRLPGDECVPARDPTVGGC